MNFHIGYTLVSRSGTSRIARQRAVVTAASLSAGFLLADVSVIVMIALLTGVGYHLAAYGELDVMSVAKTVPTLTQIDADRFGAQRRERAPGH